MKKFLTSENIIQQVEEYLEKNCTDYDWFAKKINPNWTSKEYLAFETQENYENFFAYLKAHELSDEEIQKEFERYTERGYEVFDTWEDYIKFVEQLKAQDFTPEKIEEEFQTYFLRHRIRFSVGRPDYMQSVSRTEKIIRTLKDKIGLAGSYFSNYLFKLIKQKKLTEVEVYKKANLDRRIFSKIRKEKNYMPSKQTVLALIIALELDSEEAEILLNRAGYHLTAGRKEDVIVEYFIENKIYDLFLINEVLEHYDCQTLGS